MQPTSQSGRSLQEHLFDALRAYVDAQNSRDAAQVAARIHSASPFHEPTRQALAQLYVNYALVCTLIDAELIGADAHYGYVRARQKTVRIEGPSFDDNVTDSVVVFRQENGDWKVWAQAVLTVERAS